jgi:hydrogenase expression/formation protein HypE
MTSTIGQAACPLPLTEHKQVQLAHGGGGKMMRRLISGIFGPVLQTQTGTDSATVDIAGARLAMTTDSFVVNPISFPGGDIGSLAVHGTVNDLAMSGARPLYLTCGYILEEGLELETLAGLVWSMREAADACGVRVVTGDTKVVDRGHGHGVYINTSGLGLIEHGLTLAPECVRPGDVVILSGDIGRHGVAVMVQRDGLRFETTVTSDSAPVHQPVLDLIAAGVKVRCLRDLTRGGLASALIEIVESAGCGARIEERLIPVCAGVRSACEILGLEPLYVANEGRFIAIVDASDADRAVDIMRRHAVSADAVRIGEITGPESKRLGMKTAFGVWRIIDMLSGEQLPRIC